MFCLVVTHVSRIESLNCSPYLSFVSLLPFNNIPQVHEVHIFEAFHIKRSKRIVMMRVPVSSQMVFLYDTL